MHHHPRGRERAAQKEKQRKHHHPSRKEAGKPNGNFLALSSVLKTRMRAPIAAQFMFLWALISAMCIVLSCIFLFGTVRFCCFCLCFMCVVSLFFLFCSLSLSFCFVS